MTCHASMHQPTDAPDPNHRECSDCDWTGDVSDLKAVSDPMERLGPNPHVLLPDGDCPDCGAMVYDPKDVAEADERDAKVRNYDGLLSVTKALLDLVRGLGSEEHEENFPMFAQADRLIAEANGRTLPPIATTSLELTRDALKKFCAFTEQFAPTRIGDSPVVHYGNITLTIEDFRALVTANLALTNDLLLTAHDTPDYGLDALVTLDGKIAVRCTDWKTGREWRLPSLPQVDAEGLLATVTAALNGAQSEQAAISEPASQVTIVCQTCGSDDVRRDADATWSVDAQEWELNTVFDHGDCEKCGQEATLVERPLAPPCGGEG